MMEDAGQLLLTAVLPEESIPVSTTLNINKYFNLVFLSICVSSEKHF